MSYLAIIPMALLISVGHCLGMCGGFVIAYSSKLAAKSKFLAFIYAISYHFSRVFAYVILGFLVGFFGEILKFGGFLFFIVGAFMSFLGVAMFFRGEILAFIENDRIWSKILAKPTKIAMNSDSYFGFILLGFLNGLLPCGAVYSFLSMAMISGSAFEGALIMFIFGIFTIPSLLSVSYVLNLLTIKFKNCMLMLFSFFMIIFGIYYMYLGFMVTR